MLLTSRNILITGASSGIGRATAIELAKEGANVILTGRNLQRLEETAELSNTKRFLTFDLNNTDDIVPLLKEIANEYGALSGIFHAAGIEGSLPVNIIKKKHIDEIFQSSIYAFIMLAKGISNQKVRSESCSLVTMSSAASIRGTPGLSAYSAAKAAIDGAVRSLASELASKKIRVNSIIAGAIDTEMHRKAAQKVPEKSYRDYLNKHPLGFGETKDIAKAATYLLSDQSKWVTGTSLKVDGGYCI